MTFSWIPHLDGHFWTTIVVYVCWSASESSSGTSACVDLRSSQSGAYRIRPIQERVERPMRTINNRASGFVSCVGARREQEGVQSCGGASLTVSELTLKSLIPFAWDYDRKTSGYLFIKQNSSWECFFLINLLRKIKPVIRRFMVLISAVAFLLFLTPSVWSQHLHFQAVLGFAVTPTILLNGSLWLQGCRKHSSSSSVYLFFSWVFFVWEVLGRSSVLNFNLGCKCSLQLRTNSFNISSS